MGCMTENKFYWIGIPLLVLATLVGLDGLYWLLFFSGGVPPTPQIMAFGTPIFTDGQRLVPSHSWLDWSACLDIQG